MLYNVMKQNRKEKENICIARKLFKYFNKIQFLKEVCYAFLFQQVATSHTCTHLEGFKRKVNKGKSNVNM